MKSVLLTIRESLPNLSNTEKSVAEYIYKHPKIVSTLTIRELSKQSFSSPSTIVRLCRSLGYNGYKEFNKALLYDLAAIRQNMQDRSQTISKDDNLEQIIDKVTQKNIQSLENSRRLLDLKTVEKCVELIKGANCVRLFGIGSSLLVAQDFYLKLLRLDKICILNDDLHSQMLQAMNSKTIDVAIIFSYSGQTKEMIQFATILKQNNTPTVAITRNALSPLSSIVDYVINISTNETLFRNGAMSSRLAQLNVVDILYTAFANIDYDASMNLLANTHIKKD